VDNNLSVAHLEKFLVFGFCGQAVLIPNIEELRSGVREPLIKYSSGLLPWVSAVQRHVLCEVGW